MDNPAANPGRGNYSMALNAGRILMSARSKLAEVFHINNPNDIAFTSNTTMALNLAIKGYLQPGDHVIATMVEHNSVRRPLEFLKRTQGITVDYIPVNREGEIHLPDVKRALQRRTKMVICSHSSNLLGSVLPIQEIGELAHAHGAILLVDAAQTAGHYDINVSKVSVDLLAFPGHKGLLGPQGTGGLYISPDVNLEPLMHGGTGSQSETPEQPDVRPDRYEAGTANTVGIAGLEAGVRVVMAEGVDSIYEREWKLTQYLMEGLEEIRGVSILGPDRGKVRTGIVAFNMRDRDAAQVAFQLDRLYGVAVRAGYHCTPLAHEMAGTSEQGAVRASVGYHTQQEDVETLLQAVRGIYQA